MAGSSELPSQVHSAWALMSNFLRSDPSQTPSPDILGALKTLHFAGLTNTLTSLTLHYFGRRLETIIPEFKKINLLTPPEAIFKHLESVKDQVFRLISVAYLFSRQLQDSFLYKSLQLRIRTTLEPHLTVNTRTALYHSLLPDGDGPRERIKNLCNNIDPATHLCKALSILQLQDIAEETVSAVALDVVDSFVSSCAESELRREISTDIWEDVQSNVFEWIQAVLPNGEEEAKAWYYRLRFRVFRKLGEARLERLLDIIELYPESTGALKDFKKCVQAADLKRDIVQHMTKQVEEKLLNIGTTTPELLRRYVFMIRSLRFLDPTDNVLEHISKHVNAYLRKRPDTVRCIVADMTGEGELYLELERNAKKSNTESQQNVTLLALDDEDSESVDGYLNGELKFDEEKYANWNPDPIDTPARNRTWRMGGDSITTLVSIYGRSEEIVEEYRRILADKLATCLDVDIEREIRVQQMLAERFGSEALHECAVMLLDFTESMRLEDRLQGLHNDGNDKIQSTIISKEFWPSLPDDPKFKPMPPLAIEAEIMSEAYHKLHAPRELRWQYGLGAVELELKFDDGRVTTVVLSPIQATILYHFSLKSELSVQDIAEKLEVTDTRFVRRKVQSLVSQGLLRAVEGKEGVYQPLENESDMNSTATHLEEDDGDGDGEDDDECADMRIYEKFVLAMLQNLKQVGLSQVHKMMKRFMQTPPFNKTEEELATFLSVLVKEGKVTVTAGIYKVNIDD